MNLIYSCVFFNDKYINLINLLLKSYRCFGNYSNDIDYLIICNPNFENKIKKVFDSLNINGKIWCLDFNTMFEAGFSRLEIFDYPDIHKYNKILYLDCDILITNCINRLFDIHLENKIYALEEGYTNHDFHGRQFFDENPNCTAFTSGILLFKNDIVIKELFSEILSHIYNHIKDNLRIPVCLDQPFIVYHAIKNNLYNNKILINLVVNNPDSFNGEIICHFPGNPGFYENKILKMNKFMNNILFNIQNDIPKIPLITKSMTPSIKNTTFPLIGLCISYNYIDTLKFMLPINYDHFEKIYLVTQTDDVETIEFCKKFENVEVLTYNFKNNGKKFDKYGALNMVQKIYYDKYPNHWYLIIDSDIILPVNFIEILKNENLNKDCIYGGLRTNIDKSSDLCNDITPDHAWIFNNILIDHSAICKYNNPPSIVGCFQLYFKKNVYHKENLDDAGWGDYDFCHSNFKLFCNLENIVYLHLGVSGKNWKGKKEYFIDNCNINLEQIYYNCNIKCKNNYYDEKKEIIDIIDINEEGCTLKLTNIFEDVWTCSDEFREDIKMFFKDKSDYKIAEIGSHKGYTTRYLSEIFEKVYAIDNSIEWTNFNKELNKDKKNIEYIHLDIYKDFWNIIPDVDIVFIDAQHSYKECKSDIYNSIKQFRNLKYIIFDDYGVWPGVKQNVNELLLNEMIILKKYIGLNNVPGLNDNIFKNTSE